MKLIFPMTYLNISQGRFNSFSHKGVNAYDLVGKDTGIDSMYAPCDMKCIRIYKDSYGGNTAMFQSLNKVEFANGKIDYLLMMCIHSNNATTLNKIFKKGSILFTEGTSGNTTGNHIHSEYGYGQPKSGGMYQQNSEGTWIANFNHINIEDVFYTDDSTHIIDTCNYTFKKIDSKHYFAKIIDSVSDNHTRYYTHEYKMEFINTAGVYKDEMLTNKYDTSDFQPGQKIDSNFHKYIVKNGYKYIVHKMVNQYGSTIFFAYRREKLTEI